jgi:hypothetical protein
MVLSADDDRDDLKIQRTIPAHDIECQAPGPVPNEKNAYRMRALNRLCLSLAPL